MIQTKKCKVCKRFFEKLVNCSQKEWDNQRKFCTYKCKNLSQMGKPTWNKGLTKADHKSLHKISEAKMGDKNPMRREEIRHKSSQSHLGKMMEDKHPNWKGNKVGYGALHDWVKSRLGKPTKCKHCGRFGLSGKAIHWANKSQQYLRKLSDWIRLCAKCHKSYDLKKQNN